MPGTEGERLAAAKGKTARQLEELVASERWSSACVTLQRRSIAALLGLAGALLMVAVGADLWAPASGRAAGSARLFQLVSYKYDRPWPFELDAALPLQVFSIGGAGLALALGIVALRRLALLALPCVAVGFAAWLGWSYLPRAAPYFGQREVIEALERERRGAAEPLIAYQLNWKGENFYTGNRLAIFVKSGARLARYLERRRAAGQTVFHFVLETNRTERLKAELGPGTKVEILTPRSPRHQFCLVRATLVRPGET